MLDACKEESAVIKWIGLFGLALLVACGSATSDEQSGRRPNDWLLNAATDTDRFELLQHYLRGFDQPMWEVGERYAVIYEALKRENFELAAYHWDKIKTTIENGYFKRPARQANADKLLLDKVWQEVAQSFSGVDSATAWKGFSKARSACMECHMAESMQFVNNQPLFDLVAPDAERR